MPRPKNYWLKRPLRWTSQCRKLFCEATLPEPVAKSNMTKPEFLAMVASAKEYIAAGDVFQVVLSQRFEAPFVMPPFTLYRSLRRINPAPFLFYLDFGDFVAVVQALKSWCDYAAAW